MAPGLSKYEPKYSNEYVDLSAKSLPAQVGAVACGSQIQTKAALLSDTFICPLNYGCRMACCSFGQQSEQFVLMADLFIKGPSFGRKQPNSHYCGGFNQNADLN